MTCMVSPKASPSSLALRRSEGLSSRLLDMILHHSRKLCFTGAMSSASAGPLFSVIAHTRSGLAPLTSVRP